MMMHIHDDRLQDYVDGVLDEGERAEVERHLAACAQCSAAEHELRDLLHAIAGLPRDMQPAQDLRPAIHARLDALPAHPRKTRTLWSARYALAAAALVLIALSSVLTAVVMRARVQESAGVLSTTLPDAAERFRVLEANYVTATDELERALRAQRAELAPETVQLLEENLRIIDRALAEASAALRSDPGNQALSEMLTAAYEKKLDLLRRATQPEPMRGGV